MGLNKAQHAESSISRKPESPSKKMRQETKRGSSRESEAEEIQEREKVTPNDLHGKQQFQEHRSKERLFELEELLAQ